MPRIVPLIPAILCAAFFFACDQPAPPSSEEPARNLILISIDALRADRLGSYGYARQTSPAIDGLARRGIVLDKVIAESSWTLPSHLTIFTGLYPTTHGTVDYTKSLPDGIPTLAGVLRRNGFATAAFVEGGYLNKRFGYDRGFDEWNHSRSGFGPMLKKAREFIEARHPRGRLHLFLHSYGVHCPYHPSEPYREMFARGGPEDRIDTTGYCGKRDFERMTLTEGQVRFLSDQYDGSIREVDDELGKFFDFLERRAILDDTILVILSDHGEQFMEHGEIGHEGMLYIEVLRVPVIVVAPGLDPGRISQGVGLVDVMPTLLELMGIEGPETQGRSLVPLLTGAAAVLEPRPLFSEHGEGPSMRSVIDGRFHLVSRNDERGGASGGAVELYDLEEDPTETSNVQAAHGAEVERLMGALDAHFARLRRGSAGRAREPTEEEIEKLRSLGYVE